MKRKKLNIILLIVTITYLLHKLISPFLIIFYKSQMREDELFSLSIIQSEFLLSDFVVKNIFNISVGVALIYIAKKYKKNQALWFLLGVVFNIMALLLFFVLEIHSLLKDNKISNPQSYSQRTLKTQVQKRSEKM